MNKKKIIIFVGALIVVAIGSVAAYFTLQTIQKDKAEDQTNTTTQQPTTQNKDAGEALVTKAKKHLDDAKYEEALSTYKEALAFYEKNNNKEAVDTILIEIQSIEIQIQTNKESGELQPVPPIGRPLN